MNVVLDESVAIIKPFVYLLCCIGTIIYKLGESFMKNSRLILVVALFLAIGFIIGCTDQANLPETTEENLKDEAETLEPDPAPELDELALTDERAIQKITSIIEQRFLNEKEETGDAYVLDFIAFDPDENMLTVEVIYPEDYRDFYQIEDEFYEMANEAWARFIVEDIPGLAEKEFNLTLIAISEPLSSKNTNKEADNLEEEYQTETEGEDSSNSDTTTGKITFSDSSDWVALKYQIICSTDFILDTNEYIFTAPIRLQVTDTIPAATKP